MCFSSQGLAPSVLVWLGKSSDIPLLLLGPFSWTESLVLQPELVHFICHRRVFGEETNAKSSRLRWRSSQLGPKHQLLQWVQPIPLSFGVTLIFCDGLISESIPPSSCSCPGCVNARLKHSSDEVFFRLFLGICLGRWCQFSYNQLIISQSFLASNSEDVRHLQPLLTHWCFLKL